MKLPKSAAIAIRKVCYDLICYKQKIHHVLKEWLYCGSDKKRLYMSQFQNAPFCPISASGSNFNPRNTQCIPPVKIFAFLDLGQISVDFEIEHFETGSHVQMFYFIKEAENAIFLLTNRAIASTFSAFEICKIHNPPGYGLYCRLHVNHRHSFGTNTIVTQDPHSSLLSSGLHVD